MQLVEVKNGCSFFVFQHSPEYQKVQFSFWDAVETYDPNSIAVSSVMLQHKLLRTFTLCNRLCSMLTHITLTLCFN